MFYKDCWLLAARDLLLSFHMLSQLVGSLPGSQTHCNQLQKVRTHTPIINTSCKYDQKATKSKLIPIREFTANYAFDIHNHKRPLRPDTLNIHY